MSRQEDLNATRRYWRNERIRTLQKLVGLGEIQYEDELITTMLKENFK